MRRLLRPGGRIAFTTIHLTAGLTAAQRRLAMASGPPAVADTDPAALLERAGFVDIASDDVTADYLTTARTWLETRLRHRDELRPIAPDVYDDRIAHGTAETAALAAGLLRRALCVAASPQR